jgi:hypothetical protein
MELPRPFDPEARRHESTEDDRFGLADPVKEKGRRPIRIADLHRDIE